MLTSFDAVLSSWPAQPWLAVTLLLIAVIYYRGWRLLRRRDWTRWHFGRLAAFVGGLIALYVALASPIEAFAPFLLQVHMLQHLMLMMLVPPLIWLGAPFLPLLRGLPIEIRRVWIAPLLHWRWLRQLATAITHPLVALSFFIVVTWFWHLPGQYELALTNDSWHKVQHACFFLAGLVFWFPIARPFPARPAWPTWWLLPYLILADIQNTLLSAWLTFSDHPLYPYYSHVPRLGNISALDDQAAAGVIMWVPGSVAFLLPMGWIGVRLMRASNKAFPTQNYRSRPRLCPPQTNRHALSFDLLRLPMLGVLLRGRSTRLIVQFAVLAVALAVIFDGFCGTQVGAMNLAGVLPWIHWRGIVILGLLVAGNVFCYGCPFLLPRTLARWLFPKLGNRPWPRILRSKWLAVVLVTIFLWAYDVFSLWNCPWLTAWIVIAYFAGAFLVDAIFRDASFCKYVCPIGQFNFVQSLISPWEVSVRQPAICATCSTRDCIRGNSMARGCELQLFQPRKRSNLDCTFCLDCVQACPHDNIGIIAVAPLKDFLIDAPRSGIGKLSRRVDYAVLAVILVFAAFANAAGMTEPIINWQQRFSKMLGASSTFFATTIFYGFSLLVLPTMCLITATIISRRLGLHDQTASKVGGSFAWTFIPLGFGMWMAHYSFHFFTSFDAIVPVTQQFIARAGLGLFGPPNWICSCCRPAPDWLLKAELMMLDVGLLASMYTMWNTGRRLFISAAPVEKPSQWQVFKISAPWIVLVIVLFALGVWILLQPMQMRGMLPGG